MFIGYTAADGNKGWMRSEMITHVEYGDGPGGVAMVMCDNTPVTLMLENGETAEDAALNFLKLIKIVEKGR